MKLSILIATTRQRSEVFGKLYAYLLQQINQQVEIVVLADDKQLSIGAKRQRLLQMAQGDYVAFVDDDDWLPPDYVDRLLQAMAQQPDCIGFLIDCSFNGTHKMAIGSNRYQAWAENMDGYDYVRTIYHKTPVKRQLALQAGFKDMRYGEDHDYSRRLKPLLQTEVFVDRVMYYYRYSNAEAHNSKYGIK
jgi:glycosyltransferase involved in cell wall biosynthesis